MSKLRFRTKLTASIAGLALFIGVSLSLLAYEQSKRILQDALLDAVIQTTNTGRMQLHAWVETLQSEVIRMSRQNTIMNTFIGDDKDRETFQGESSHSDARTA